MTLQWYREFVMYIALFLFFIQLQILTVKAQTGILVPKEVIPILEKQQELDQSVWALEIESRKYERTVVSIWNSLIKSNHDLKILEDLKFDSLKIGRLT